MHLDSVFLKSFILCFQIDPAPFDVLSNGKRILSVNLKSKEGVDVVKRLCSMSDIVLDTYRPGVMEKLGLGPDELMKDNSCLIYARLTGYGQNGHYALKAGHDINYVAMSGILSMLSKNKEPPTAPINLLADFAGGSVMCALGILMALFERTKSGKGQVIDCSMTEGAAYIGTWLFRSRKLPIWSGEPGTNALDGGLACYATYKTKDGKFMAVGALEPQFYSNFLKGLQLSEEEYAQFSDEERCRQKFSKIFLTRNQEDWCKIFENLDACVTPVLDHNIVDKHKCNQSRKSFYKNNDNDVLPEAAPRLSRTPAESAGRKPLPKHGQHTFDILNELGYNKSEIDYLIEKGYAYTNKKSNL